MLRLRIEPLDILLFRDGRPFGLGDSARSVFPPSPLTFQGAVRAKLWANKEQIPESWLDPESPPLKFYGPFLEKDDTLLFLIPSAALRCSFVETKFMDKSNCNIEWIKKLPFPQEGDDRILFLPLPQFKDYLKGEVKDIYPIDCNQLWMEEERPSIRITPESLTVSEEDALFTISFTRLKSGVRFSFFVEAEENEELLGEILSKEPRALILGGERRPVIYELRKEDLRDLFRDVRETIENGAQGGDVMKIIFLTPSIPKENWIPNSLGGRNIISALIPKPVAIGGWDYRENKPRPLRYALPAGTTFWVKKINIEDFWFNFHSDYFPNLGLGLTCVGKDESRDAG